MVTGDGMKNLDALIAEKNLHRDPEVAEVIPDEKMDWFLKRQLSFDGRITLAKVQVKNPWKITFDENWDRSLFTSYIPKAGEIVYLNEKIGVSYGGGSAEEYDICHPDNKAVMEKAARTFGDTIIGFDFMIPDISRSWREQCCGFIEANSVPFINLHHHPLKGKPRNIAAKVWDGIQF